MNTQFPFTKIYPLIQYAYDSMYIYRPNISGTYVNTSVEVLFFNIMQISLIKLDCE